MFSCDIANAVSLDKVPLSMQSAAFRPKQLLRQPGGFEGAVLVEVRGEANDLAVTEGIDVEAMIPDHGIAPPHAPAIAHLDHHVLLVGVDHLIELDVEVFEGLHVGAQSFESGVEPSDDVEI